MRLLQPERWPPPMRAVVAFSVGGLSVLGFAPFALSGLPLLILAVLFRLWLASTPRQALLLGWLFGAGLLGFGVFWLRVSLAEFGGVNLPLAVVLALAFALSLAGLFGLAGWLGARVARVNTATALLLVYPAAWVLFEWLRGWLLGGFPWLSLGYSQIDAPLGGLAPILGIYGVSAGVALSAGLLAYMLTPVCARRYLATAGVALIWIGAALLGQVQWTVPAGAAFRVALIQGNVPQALKWLPQQFAATVGLYQELTEQQPEAKLVIWPETAVPAFAHQVEQRLLAPWQRRMRDEGRDLLLGIPIKESDSRYFNAMLVLGASGRDAYYKRHLVPFGEFMPLRSLLEPLIEVFAVPLGDFTPGDRDKPPLLTVAGYPAGISICYEDAFAEEVAQALPAAAFLVNATNDAWFGDSLAPHQHLQIARMRARETGRDLLRASNTGISALIGPRGKIRAQAPLFEQAVVSGEVVPRQGGTPYSYVGNAPIVSLAVVTLLLVGIRRVRQ